MFRWKGKTRKPLNRATQELFHAVAIRSDDLVLCCKTVTPLLGQRYLAEEAPRLPVDGCSNPACGCAYEHYSDRRTQLRRDSDVGMPAQVYTIGEARTGSGRRVTDR